MKNHLIHMMKLQLNEAVQNLDYKNLNETVEIFSNCFAILEAAGALPDMPFPVQAEIKIDEEKHQEPVVTATPVQEVEEAKDTGLTVTNAITVSSNRKGPFRFERKFKGGFVPDSQAFVPEKIVRELDLTHGDYVYVTFAQNVVNGPIHYTYEVAERKNGKDPIDREQIDYAIVEYDTGISRYIATKTATGSRIRFEDAPYTVVLPEDDVNELKLKVDDIIDITMSKSNPNYVRVIWRHSIDETIPEKRDIKPASFYKDKKKNDDGQAVKEIFKGKKICMMGYEPGKEAIRTEVEKRGGEFIWVSGRETNTSLSASLGKADAVVLMLGHVGHSGTIFAVDYCKRNGIPSVSSHSFGRSQFVAKAEEALSVHAE